MHDLLTKAVEAGARAAAEGAGCSWHLLSTAESCRWTLRSEAVLRAALPGILEAVVGVADDHGQAWGAAMRSPADVIASAQRALVAQILETGK